MKKTITIITGLMLLSGVSEAQFYASDFEDLVLPADSFYQDTTGADFSSGNGIFQYEWSQSQWGDYWSGGFVYTNMTDSVTSGYGNLYSAETGVGYNSSANYAVGMNYSRIRMASTVGNVVHGFYITNSTYAYNSMRDGDMFAKKFGGTTGDDPDWFKVVLRGYYMGNVLPDSIEFYLADFRFSDNSQDYIVKTWEYIDVYSVPGFNMVDSVAFELSSSDVGAFGMNTPAYFCLDDFSSSPVVIGLKENKTGEISISPNPAQDEIMVKLVNAINIIGICSIVDITGTEVRSATIAAGSNSVKLDISDLAKGVYIVRVISGSDVITQKIIKE